MAGIVTDTDRWQDRRKTEGETYSKPRQTRFEQFRIPAREMKKRGPLDQFFKPAPAGPLQQYQVEQDAPLPEQQSPPPLPPPKKARTAHQQDPAAAVANDIGQFVGVPLGAISDQDKLLMINEPWIPPPGYHFPLLKDGQHRRAFQMKWLHSAPTVSLGEIQPVSPRRLLCRLCSRPTIWTRRSHAGSASVTHV